MGTSASENQVRPGDRRSYRIANGSDIAAGEYVCLNASGDAVEAADTADFIPLGLAIGFSQKDTGDGTDQGDTTANDPPEVELDVGGGILNGITVTGAAGNDTDKGAPVYVTGGTTYTTVPTSNLPAVGEIVRSASATDIDVELYPADAISAASRGLVSKEDLLLGLLDTRAMEGVAQLDILARTLQGSGKIRQLVIRPTGFDAAAVAGSQDLSVLIGGTPVGFSAGINVNHEDMDAAADLIVLNTIGTTASATWSDGQSLIIRQATGGEGFTAGVDAHFEVLARVDRYGN